MHDRLGMVNQWTCDCPVDKGNCFHLLAALLPEMSL